MAAFSSGGLDRRGGVVLDSGTAASDLAFDDRAGFAGGVFVG